LSRRTGVIATAAIAAIPATAQAQTGLLNKQSAEFASHEGNIAFLALGVGLPLLRDGADGKSHALRAADALLTSTVLSETIKAIARKRRPDGSDRKSFPSGHATAAFAIAAMQSDFHPREAPLWYAGAALIADSRVSLRRHDVTDVLAGAALGWGTSRAELGSRRGLILSPFISVDRRGRFALRLSGSF
jgi:membrane-associated phospholipid phosphatase